MRKFEMEYFVRLMENWDEKIVFVDKDDDDLFVIHLINEKDHSDRYVSEKFTYNEMINELEKHVKPYNSKIAKYIKQAMEFELETDDLLEV